MSPSMGVSMPKITISGHPGSGTSTLVSGLVNHFNWRYLNGGQVFRDEAKSRNMTLEEFGELCVSDTNIDKLLDEKLRQRISENEIEVVESRLSGWWAFKLSMNCPRIWLHVDEDERASRVVSREGISFEQALKDNRKRLLLDSKRYQELYNLAVDDEEPYTHVIDATNINAQQLLTKVVAILEEW